MSPSSAGTEPVRLIASAPPGTDIYIIDSQFRLLAHEVRRLDRALPPGIYKVKFQAGSAVHEEHVSLEPGGPAVDIRCPPLAFRSSAPLAGTRITHDYHMDNAHTHSRAVHVRDGQGAQLFLFARAWTDPNGSDRSAPFPRGQHPATGMTLHDVEGRLVADLEHAGTADLNVADPWSACNIDLAPGPYRLRLQVPEIGALEQILVAPAGWQVQVFLLQGDYADPEQSIYRSDLTTSSILLARGGVGFDPANDSLRLTELARTALTRRHVVVARDLLHQLLESKFENPMLGLYAAHALLAASEPDRELLQIVVQHLRGMLGQHPDVDALALYLGEQVGRAYKVPPMLRRSWSIVVERAARRRDLVPAGSLASRAGNAIWGNSAWLIWEAEGVEESAEDGPALEEGLLKVEDLAARLASSEGDAPADADLDDTEQAMLSYVARRAKYRGRTHRRPDPVQPAEPEVGTGALGVPAPSPSNEDPFESASQVSEALGLPPSTVQRTVGRLLRKLERPS